MRIIRPSEINIWPETKAVWIPAGQFWMGSPTNEIGRFSNEYRHRVDLQQGFWLWQTEVTQGQFTALMGYNPSRSQQYGSALPVERVSWHEAVFFAHTLSQKMDLPSCFSCQGEGNSVICQSLPQFAGQKYYECKGWRLPTEAEWEYAYRAGSDTSLYNGQLAAPLGYDPILDLLAWYDKNSNQRPHPVARKQPNAWGLFDMAGNVEEWCWNWYARYPQKSLVSNPSGPLKGSERVIRGGSWYDSARKARAAERGSLAPSWREDTVGFRLVCTGL
jgi:formylglycine-generating enzyme required for sulfatase activity